MTRVNLVLLLAVLASALYLVNVQYESRRLFAEIDRAQLEARHLETEREQLELEKRQQATPQRVEKLAKEQAWSMRAATPAITDYVSYQPRSAPPRGPAGRGRAPARPQVVPRRRAQLPMSSRSIQYTSSPLLASRTPVWRSKFVVALIAAGLRRYWPAGPPTSRCCPTPSSRSRARCALRARWKCRPTAAASWTATDRSWPPAYWRPASGRSRKTWSASRSSCSVWPGLLDMSLSELNRKLEDEDKTFVWLKRQVDEPVAKQIAALNIKGIYQRKEYKRQYPEGEMAAHLVGFTNVEDHGQEGVELAFNQTLAGKPGSRRVIKDRLGNVVEVVGEQVPPVEGRDVQLSIDSKIQFFAYQRLKQAVRENQAKAGSVVVLDAQTGEMLALANYPSYVPGKRQSFKDVPLRNRALTDSFEPGSTVKPFVAALALEKGLVDAGHPDSDQQQRPSEFRRRHHQRHAPVSPC